MPEREPLSMRCVEAACERHATLDSWRRSDEALEAISRGVNGFSPAATLAKAVAVNALYYTNVVAIVRVAEHFATVLADTDLTTATPELVVRLAAVPRGGNEKKKVRRPSLAAKFAHFFVDGDRFPIYDKYAVRMVARHTGRTIASLDGDYVAFAEAIEELAVELEMRNDRRRLDRYLWIQGQYEEWRKSEKASSGDLKGLFERGEWPPRD